MTTTVVQEQITIVQLAARTGHSLDFVRKHFRTDGRLSELVRHLGPTRFIRSEDFEQAKQILDAHAAGARSARPGSNR